MGVGAIFDLDNRCTNWIDSDLRQLSMRGMTCSRFPGRLVLGVHAAVLVAV